jgi:hypothetical protein
MKSTGCTGRNLQTSGSFRPKRVVCCIQRRYTSLVSGLYFFRTQGPCIAFITLNALMGPTRGRSLINC